MSRAIRIAAGLAILIPLCSTAGQDSVEANDPELNFEHAWSVFDRIYGQFVNRRVDWDALYAVEEVAVPVPGARDDLQPAGRGVPEQR
jgi:hypothetical protein